MLPKAIQYTGLLLYIFIANPHKKPCVNHINNIRHDNRIENLEWVTHRENICHSKQFGKKLTSKYTGVSFDKRRERWCANIWINGKFVNLGVFKKENDASKAVLVKMKENGIKNKYKQLINF